MGPLYVKCKTCHLWFKSGLSVESFDLKPQTAMERVHECPMGHRHFYSREDYANEARFGPRVRRVSGRVVQA